MPVRWQRAARGRGEMKLGHRLEDGQHLVFTHDQVLVAVYLDLLARVLAEQDGVAFLHVQRGALAVVLDLAGAGGNDFALLRLFLGRVRDDDPADLLLTFLDALDDDAVVERSVLSWSDSVAVEFVELA